MPSSRHLASVIVVALLIPTVLPFIPAAEAATVPSRRVMAEYDAFANIPAVADIEAGGLEFRYAFKSIPAIIVYGSEIDINELRANTHLVRIIEDGPLEYAMQTAVFSTNVADVWADTWWPTPGDLNRRSPSPVVIDGQVIDGTGITVAVVDSGIQAAHPDLFYEPLYVDGTMQWEPKVKACWNIPGLIGEAGDNPYCDQTVGHGTHVAGTVAGNAYAARNGLSPTYPNPARPPMGAAPNASLVGMGLGVAINIIDAAGALDYVYDVADEYGIRVATNSWGNTNPACSGSVNGDANDVTNQIAKRLVDQKGITVLFAAGNYDTNGKTWTSTYARNPHPGVITVANYDDRNLGTRAGRISGGSSDGCTKPESTGDFVWTWPDVAAPGTAITSTTIPPTVVHGIGVAGYPTQQYLPFYATIDGTSMATPHVAGIAALMYQANPDITPAQVEKILIETATRWTDSVSSRSVPGTSMWNADPALCKVSPADAAKAEAGDATVNAEFPGFTTLATITDASLYVCRDYRRGAGLVDGYAAVQAAIDLRDDQGNEAPAIRITSPLDGAEVDATILDVTGIVDRFGAGSAPSAALTASPLSGQSPLDVTFTLAANDADGTIASWSLNFGDATSPASGTGLPPATLTHTYTGAAGTRTATLTVVDDDSLTASVGVIVTIEPVVNQGRVLWLVGDGSTTAVTNDAEVVASRTFGLSPAANGNLETTYTTVGSWNADAPNNAFIPTFGPSPPVTIATGSTLTLKVHVDYAFAGNQLGNICPLAAQLFTADNTVLGPATGADGFVAPGLGTYREITWTFAPAAGTYNGLKVQFGPTGVDCGSFPSKWAWGTSALNGRLILGPNDSGGGPGPAALTMDGSDSIGVSGLDLVSMGHQITKSGRADIQLDLAGAPVSMAAGYPAIYELQIDQARLKLDRASGSITNAASGATIAGASVVFDDASKQIRVSLSKVALAALGAASPYEVSARSVLVQQGALVTIDAIPDTPGASTTQPLDDPDDDQVAGMAGTDIRAVLVGDETASTFKVTLKVDDLASAEPTAFLVDAMAPVNKRQAGLRLVFTSSFQFAETPTNLVNYQVSTSRYFMKIRSDGTYEQTATLCNLETFPPAATGVNLISTLAEIPCVWDTAANTITWTVPKAQMDVIRAAQAQTETSTRGSPNTPEAGDTLGGFGAQSRTWIYAGAGLGPGQTIWDTAEGVGGYTFNGGNALPTATLAATPVTGSPPLDVTFTLGGADSDGSVASWTLDFGDATTAATGTGALSTQLVHTYAATGAYTARLTVRDDRGAIAEATQAIVVGTPAGERVELFLDGVFESATLVSTSRSSPTAAWTLPADVAGLGGIHALAAKWFNADGVFLAQTSIEVDLGNMVPVVSITSPAEGSTVNGILDVSGTAGHVVSTSGEEPSSGASFTLLPDGTLRATSSFDFESGAEGWIVMNEAWRVNGQNVPGTNQVNNQPDGVHAAWHLQDAWSTNGGNAWCACDRTDQGLYNPGIRTNLVSPTIDATGDSTGTVDFTVSGSVGEGDVMFVQWKPAGEGGTWTTFRTIGEDYVVPFPDNGLIWTPVSAALPAEALGQPIQIRFRFEAQADPDAYLKLAWGYLLDDVVVTTQSSTVSAPGVPLGFSAVGELGAVALAWLAPADDGGAPVTSYNIYRDNVLLASQATTAYTDNAVTPGTSYSYQVSAANLAGEGARTAAASATPLADTVVTTLAITSPTNGAEVAPTVSFAGTYPSGDDEETGDEDDARVVVSVIDSGLNVYHSFFYAGSPIYPAGSPPSAVTSAVLEELGIDAAHQVQLTRTGSFAADFAADSAKWAAIRAQPGALWWFKGTNLIATSPGGSGGDVIIPDDDGDAHGTGTSASVLLANPEAIVLFCEDTEPDCEQAMFTLPGVDIVSTSYGPPGSIPYALNPIFDWPATRTHMAASYAGVVENGKLHFGAADNSPAPAIQDSTAGAWWSIGVTGFDDAAGGHQSSSGTLADFAASFTVTAPYCRTSETCMESVSGTSFATPTSAGVASKVLLEARRAAGHMGGITTLGGEKVMVAGGGDAITNWELRRALEEAAVYDSIADYDPVEGVFWQSMPILDPAPWTEVGWGRLAAIPDVVSGALDQLAGAAPLKGAEACAYMTTVHDGRHAYYDNNPFSDSFGTAEDAYIHCGDSTEPAMSFAPLAERGEISDGEDDVPAPPPYDILAVDIDDDGVFLTSTWDLSFIIGDDEVAAPEANAAWFDFAFAVDGTEYILEAQGDLDAGQVDTGYTATLWHRTVDEIRGEVWSVVEGANTLYEMDWVNNQFTMGVGLADVVAEPGDVVTNTWASVWPNTRVGYVVPYDTAPNGATHASQDGDTFGEEYTIGGGDIVTPDPEVVRIVVSDGTTDVIGNATLNAITHTWTYDPAGDLAAGAYTASATYYEDGLATAGPVSVAFTVVTTNGDVTPPVIDEVVVDPTQTSATISWATDEPATTLVRYGTTSAYGFEVSISGFSTQHAVSFGDLEPGTTYHFQVVSADASGNAAQTPDSTFATVALPADRVELFADGIQVGTAIVDTLEGDDTWTVVVDTTDLPEGMTELLAHFRDSDGATADASILVNVDNLANRAPDFPEIGDQAAQEGLEFTLELDASDPDRDTLSYSAVGLPTGALLDSQTGAIRYSPDYDAAGTYAGISVSVSDGPETVTRTFTLVVEDTPRPPRLTPIADVVAVKGHLLEIAVAASDPDGGLLTLTVAGAHAEAVFTDNGDDTGVFSWTPNFEVPSGDWVVTFAVSDASGLFDEQDVTIFVTEPNRPPVLNAIGDQSVSEGASLVIDLTTSDPDGDAVTLSATGLPDGAEFDGSAKRFRWTPDFEDAGTHAVTFSASDGEFTTSETIDVVVENTNRAPDLATIPPQSVGENEQLTFSVGATDADGDAVTITASGLPAGATFDGSTFDWTPTFEQGGVHVVTFTASDGSLSDAQDVGIAVGDVDRAPVLDPIAPQTVAEASLLSFVVTGSDPDGGAVTFAATGLPSGATFTPATGTFSWTPSYTQANSYTVRFTVSDGVTTIGQDVLITVTDTDRAPVFSPIANGSVRQGSRIDLLLTASDPDGDAVGFVIDGPAGATIGSDNSGRPTLRWSPTLDFLGPQTFTVHAVAGSLATTRTTTVTVLFNTSFTVAHATESSALVSPGQVVTVSARITNTGPQTDTFALGLQHSVLWRHTPLPAFVMLAPGESIVVSTDVTVPLSQAISFTTIRATSQGDPSIAREVRFRFEVPVNITVEGLGHLTNLVDVPRGVVIMKHLDGTPAVGALVTVEQMSQAIGGNTKTTASGTADANGEFRFDFGNDPRAMTPGHHQLVVTAKKPGGVDSTHVTGYNVGTNVV